MTTTQPARIKRRPPSAKRAWRRQRYEQATTSTARAQAAWNWMTPAIKAHPNLPQATALVHEAIKVCLACQRGMDAQITLTAGEAKRRDWCRREYTRAATAWAQMLRAYANVLSSAKALASPRHLTAGEHTRRLGERDRLMNQLAADLARLAAHAEGT